MTTKEKKDTPKIESFDPKKSIGRARNARRQGSKWVIKTSGGIVMWSNRLERVAIIRKGLPYESIEIIGQKANLPVRQVLHYLGVPQTTYNKKKRENDHLSGRDSEIILVLSEISLSNSDISKSPLSRIGITLSIALFSLHKICQGTILEWCSISEIRISSPSFILSLP